MLRLPVVVLCVGVVVCGATSVGVAVQDVPPSASKGLTDTVESWYKILQSGEQVGYAHVVLRPVPAVAWRYELTLEEDAEVEVGGEFFQISSRVHQGYLDENFDPVDVQTSLTVRGIPVQVRLYRDAGERRVVVTLPGEKPIEFSGGDAHVSVDLDLSLLHLQQSGRLEAGARLRLMLLDYDAQARPRAMPVQLIVAGVEEREYLGKKSKVTRIDVENYPSAVPDLAVRTVYVDGNGRMVETLTMGTLRMVLAKDSREAKGEARRVVQHGRRDPFRKDLAMGAPAEAKTGRDEGTSRGSGLEIRPGQEAQKLKDAEAIVKEMEKLDRAKQQAELAAKYQEFIAIFLPLRRHLQKDAKMARDLQALDALKERAENCHPGAQRVFEEAHRIYAEIGRLALLSNCKEMEKLHLEMTAYRDRPELINSPKLLELEKIIGEARSMVERCKIREELKNKKVLVTGTTLHERPMPVPVRIRIDLLGHRLSLERTAELIESEAYAVINGEVYRAGDALLKDPEVRVERIDKFGVQISYKGEVRDIQTRQ